TQEDLSLEDLITPEEVVITLSHEGYAKSQSLNLYQAQRRGGKGKTATSMKDEDFIEQLIIAHTHDTILCFSNHGKVYWLKSYQVPQASRIARGKPIVNLLPLASDERINAILPVKEYREDQYVFMATEAGVVKKVSLDNFSRPRANGIIALELDEGDRLVGVALTDGQRDVMIFSNAGKVIRFPEAKVRPMGRTARGVRGIALQENQKVISLIIAQETGDILTATEKGYGKRTPIEEYRLTGRGGQGVISIQVNERNGNVVGATQITAGEEVMLITDRGTLIRTRADEISVVGRNTQGVRLINPAEDEKLIQIQRIVDTAEEQA
ncbi:MAG: DNA gyrase subunit A, partial [Gammaproteobacteria bacterium]|nr:DNA gyrase subunit A [Gammaproteobacteria bacterium]